MITHIDSEHRTKQHPYGRKTGQVGEFMFLMVMSSAEMRGRAEKLACRFGIPMKVLRIEFIEIINRIEARTQSLEPSRVQN